MNNSTPQRKPGFVSNTAAMEVKSSLISARDLRDALVSHVMFLQDYQNLRGYLLLLNPKLSLEYLEREVKDFKRALRIEIADRVHLVIVKHGDIVLGNDCISEKDRLLLNKGIESHKKTSSNIINASKRDEVFLLMLHQWITGQSSMTTKWIEDTVGCNYRTVSNEIERLGHAVQRSSDRSVSLKHFPEQEFGRILALMFKIRSTMLYTDTSGQPRSPESLVKRLHTMGRNDVAVGGVFGAKRYYKNLDIIGSPRLDLLIHCPHKQVDLEFISKLDPALVRTHNSHGSVLVALHFVCRRVSLFDRAKDGTLWADPVESLLELYNANLDTQARSFQDFLAMRGSELNG